MQNQLSNSPNGWLAFELNVLRRLKFQTAILPFTNEPNLGTYLKRWNVGVFANDLLQSSWIKSVASIENNTEALSEKAVQMVLEDAYVPKYRLNNQRLRDWFNETDAWWFDNVRQNIETLSSPIARAIAFSIGLKVGDYVMSFSEETRELRQPLSKVFNRLLSIFPKPINNQKENLCQNIAPHEFIGSHYKVDLMFLRLPAAHTENLKNYLGWKAWREDWVSGSNDFWNEVENLRTGKLGTQVGTKSQYLQLLEDTLQTASHIPLWSIAHIDDNFVSTQDIVEIVGKIRRVDTVFSKDFSEITGKKGVIITA